MKFEVGDYVRVVSAASAFWGWAGVVIKAFDGDLIMGQKHYQVEVRIKPPSSVLEGFFRIEFVVPLLFLEMELAYAQDPIDRD